MMFQDYALFPFMSVAENVGYGIHGRTDQSERVTRLLELVGFSCKLGNLLSKFLQACPGIRADVVHGLLHLSSSHEF